MAHSHDKTYIASLGFADRDKQDPLHDLGCQYVVQSASGGSLGQLLEPSRKFRGFRYEAMIEKGTGQYKTTVGFIDAVIGFGEVVGGLAQGDSEHHVSSFSDWMVEVKIAPLPLGDVLRQLHLYNSYLEIGGSSPKWVVAVAFEMSTLFAEGLRHHQITPVHLGENFQKWVAAQRALPKASDVPSI